jgi:hypothetical protein
MMKYSSIARTYSTVAIAIQAGEYREIALGQ